MVKATNYSFLMLIALMLMAQVSVAQHNTVHFTDHDHYEHSHEHEDDHNPQKQANELCQLCINVKSLAFGITPDQNVLHLNATAYDVETAHVHVLITKNRFELYHTRAPPILLI